MIYRHYFKIKQPAKYSIGLQKNYDTMNKGNVQELDISDKLTIIGIILTIIFTGIYPFMQKPLLDYSILDPDKRWITTWNNYLTRLRLFYRKLCNHFLIIRSFHIIYQIKYPSLIVMKIVFILL
jgi:hypothetical protein